MANVVVTGGHTGIGFELVKRLIQEGHRVAVLARSAERVVAIKEAVAPSVLEFFAVDLASQGEVERVAHKIRSEWEHIDVLFNNAGVLLGDLRQSPQGNEMHYEVNTLAPLLLTRNLKPLFDAAAHPVVVNTSTDPVGSAKEIDFATLHRPKRIVRLFGSYVVSKVAVAAAMTAIAQAPEWSQVRIFNVAPGAIKTPMTSGDGMPFWLKPIRNLIFSSPEKGAARLFEAAFDDDRLRSPAFVVGGKMRFRMGLSQKGIPSPLVMGVLMAPGATL
ncbi:MAG: SDR family NAD(P)-dependent oxidoreductase, partial [Myxococcota bacterium]